MNAVSLRTESFTAVDQPNSLFKSQTAVIWVVAVIGSFLAVLWVVRRRSKKSKE
jgi:hypothetical protein